MSRGKRHMGQGLEETKSKLPIVLSQWSHMGLCLIPLESNYDMYEVLSTRKLIRGSTPKFFTGGCPCRHPLPSAF